MRKMFNVSSSPRYGKNSVIWNINENILSRGY